MSTEGDIVKLSEAISSKTAELVGFYKANNIPLPSTDEVAPPASPLPPNMIQTKMDILVAMDQLKALIQDPLDTFLNIVSPAQINLMPALDAAVKHRIPSHVKPGQQISYQELSEECNLNASDLQRIVRMLISFGFFTEPQKGFVKHNSVSRIAYDVPPLADWLAYGTKYIWSSTFPLIDAMNRWPDGQELNETAFHLLRGETFWDSLKNNQENARLFKSTMQFLQNDPRFGAHHLVQNLGWSENDCPQLMVDVGGNHGFIAADILRAFPVTKCIVQDLPEVVAEASVPDDLKGRLEFNDHDFFTPQPIKADVYLLRSICHDWSDKYATKIISNLIPALKPGARIIINEVCMPDPGTIPGYLESTIRGYDLCMKQFFNSKERSIEEWDALFHNCDQRFKRSWVKMSPGSALSVIQYVWDI